MNKFSRNVLFSKDSIDFINSIQENRKDNVKKYINSNIRRWLINYYDKVTIIQEYNESYPSWVQKALNEGSTVYLLNIEEDDKNKIFYWLNYLEILNKKDLSRISVPQLIKNVASLNKELTKCTNVNDEEGIEIIHQYDDKFSWVKIFGRESLYREGYMMNNCVSNYYDDVSCNKTNIYSLRDTNNKPHVTLEVKNNVVTQIKGNCNLSVKKEYTDYVKDFLHNEYVKFNDIDDDEYGNIGLIKINDKWYSVYNLPEELVVYHNLYLTCRDDEWINLPDSLVVHGDFLDLRNVNILKFPSKLIADGHVNLSHTRINKLPKEFSCKCGLNLSHTMITELPDNMTINGDLNLAHTGIRKLPNKLYVENTLFLTHDDIDVFPDDLYAFYLDLSYTNIKEYPHEIEYKCLGLNISHTDITELPDNLFIEGSFDISYTKIKKLPNNLSVNSCLYMKGMNITELPKDLYSRGLSFKYSTIEDGALDNMIVDEFLDISHTNIKKFPKNLTVNGMLFASDSVFDVISKDLKVKSSMIFSNSHINEIPEDFTVNGKLDLSGAVVKKFPKRMTIKGNLIIRDSNIKELSDGIIVTGKIIK